MTIEGARDCLGWQGPILPGFPVFARTQLVEHDRLAARDGWRSDASLHAARERLPEGFSRQAHSLTLRFAGMHEHGYDCRDTGFSAAEQES